MNLAFFGGEGAFPRLPTSSNRMETPPVKKKKCKVPYTTEGRWGEMVGETGWLASLHVHLSFYFLFLQVSSVVCYAACIAARIAKFKDTKAPQSASHIPCLRVRVQTNSWSVAAQENNDNSKPRTIFDKKQTEEEEKAERLFSCLCLLGSLGDLCDVLLVLRLHLSFALAPLECLLVSVLVVHRHSQDAIFAERVFV